MKSITKVIQLPYFTSALTVLLNAVNSALTVEKQGYDEMNTPQQTNVTILSVTAMIFDK